MILFYEKTKFKLKNKLILKNWIKDTCKEEQKDVGDISVILYNSDDFLKINFKYLNHNNMTDVITFDYTIENKISGDIFINIDCIALNSKKYKNEFENELYRVIIHGVLHLLNYNDKTKKEKEEMRKKEDFYLFLLNNLNIN